MSMTTGLYAPDLPQDEVDPRFDEIASDLGYPLDESSNFKYERIDAAGRDARNSYEQEQQFDPNPIKMGGAAVGDVSRTGDVQTAPAPVELSKTAKIARWGYEVIALRDLMQYNSDN